MCLAMLNVKGRVGKQKFINAWSSNPDGFGCAYICKKSGKLRYWRTLDEDKAYGGYCKAFDKSAGPMILHWRFGTHGEGIKNVHPFKVTNDLAMAHNGILDTFLYDAEMSDTANFVKHILAYLPPRFVEFEHYQDFLEMACGVSNKLIFLQRDGFYHITNEKQGHWVGGNWYSNHSYKSFNMGSRYSGCTTSYYGGGHASAWDPDNDDTYKISGNAGVGQGYPKLPSAITAPLRNKAATMTQEAVIGDEEDREAITAALDKSLQEANLEEVDILDLAASEETSVLDAIDEVVDDVRDELNDDVPPIEGFGSGIAACMEIERGSEGGPRMDVDGEFEEYFPCGYNEGNSVDAVIGSVAP